MATTMAPARQPFAPLNNSRLQNLTSLKNRQNAISSLSSSSSVKRKAHSYEEDNSENIDPIMFLSPKRSRCPDGSSKDTLCKPTNFFLGAAPPSPNNYSNLLPNVTSPRRPILTARSPAPRLNTSTPISAPAGRSPTRKRIGILNRRKTNPSPFTRIDPPRFSTAAPSTSLSFSIDAALSSTLPSSFVHKPVPVSVPKVHDLRVSLHAEQIRDSWFFDIHEDTEEELATNLMEHGACTLDISSDEECAARERDLRGKENVPPVDDISQTRVRITADAGVEAMKDVKARVRGMRRSEDIIEVDRCPLGDLAAEDFYAEGCDGESVVLIEDEDEHAEDEEIHEEVAQASFELTLDVNVDVKGKGEDVQLDVIVAELMQKDDFEVAPRATLLDPIERAEDGFEVWESGSTKGDE